MKLDQKSSLEPSLRVPWATIQKRPHQGRLADTAESNLPAEKDELQLKELEKLDLWEDFLCSS